MGRGARRYVASLLGCALLGALLAGCGSDGSSKVHTIAILRTVAGSPGESAFLPALADGGFPRDRLRILAADPAEVHATTDDAEAAVRRWERGGAELILALSTSAAIAARAAAPDVPVLFLSSDPQGTGLVRDTRHPEGNRTGVGYRVPSDRFLSIAQDAFGDLSSVGCVYAADDPASGPPLADLRRGAKALGMSLTCADFATATATGVRSSIDRVLAAGAQVLVVPSAAKTAAAFPRLTQALAALPVPVVTTTAADFAVLTLQPDSKEVYRQLGRQAARLLHGAATAEVPVEDPGHYLLVVNLRVAARIGRTIPKELVDRADQVIR